MPGALKISDDALLLFNSNCHVFAGAPGLVDRDEHVKQQDDDASNGYVKERLSRGFLHRRLAFIAESREIAILVESVSVRKPVKA